MKISDFEDHTVEYRRERMDFNKALRPYPFAEFEFHYRGHEMEELHIQDGDLLIIDRSIKPTDGCIAIVIFENQFLCRQILFSKKWNCFVFYYQGKWERVKEIFGIASYNIHTLSGRSI